MNITVCSMSGLSPFQTNMVFSTRKKIANLSHQDRGEVRSIFMAVLFCRNTVPRLGIAREAHGLSEKRNSIAVLPSHFFGADEELLS